MDAKGGPGGGNLEYIINKVHVSARMNVKETLRMVFVYCCILYQIPLKSVKTFRMFVVSQEYFRNDLLNFVGSQQKISGIIWGKKDETCAIVTSGGESGKSLGYTDKKNDDGSFLYIGQGGKGDQNPKRFSNSLLVNGQRSILLFTTSEPTAEQKKRLDSRRKLYTFEGIFEVKSWNFITVTEGKRKNDKLLEFLLVPVNNIYNTYTPIGSQLFANSKKPTLAELRKKVKHLSSKPPKGSVATREYFMRSEDIVMYAIVRADGNCEYCNNPGPFEDLKGNLFLEVHHIHRLADDGPDSPQNVAAICPNCHKEAHFGKNKNAIRERLAEIIQNKEISLDKKG